MAKYATKDAEPMIWDRIPPAPLSPVSESNSSQPVMVVPRLEPSTIPIAWVNFIIPALTKLTAITLVAPDD